MKRRKTSPVAVTPAVSETSELRTRRLEIMRGIQQMQWEFDKHPTVELVRELRKLRGVLSNIEEMIAETSERVQFSRNLERLEGIVSRAASSGITEHS